MCSFSPCIEQVQRTCEELTKHDFGDITTIECLVRNFDIRTINLPQPNLGYNINLPKADLGKLPEGEGDGEPPVKHMKTDMTETGADSKYRSETTQEANMDSEENDQGNSDDDDQDKSDSEEKTYGNKKNTRHDVGLMGKEDEWHFTFKTAGPPTKMPGHTGFLTFATLYPV